MKFVTIVGQRLAYAFILILAVVVLNFLLVLGGRVFPCADITAG